MIRFLDSNCRYTEISTDLKPFASFFSFIFPLFFFLQIIMHSMHVYLSFIYLNPSFVFCFQLNNFSLMVCDTIFWIQIATRLRYPRIKSLFQFFSFVSLGFFFTNDYAKHARLFIAKFALI